MKTTPPASRRKNVTQTSSLYPGSTPQAESLSHAPAQSDPFRPSAFRIFFALLLLLGFGGSSAFAANYTWKTNPGTSAWGTSTNWLSASGTGTPGTSDVAVFSSTSSITTISAGVTAGSITFDTATAGAYIIGTGAVDSQTYVMAGSTTLQMTSTVANNETFNAKLQLGGNSAAATYNITNESTTNKFIFNGSILGGYQLRRARKSWLSAARVILISTERLPVAAPPRLP